MLFSWHYGRLYIDPFYIIQVHTKHMVMDSYKVLCTKNARPPMFIKIMQDLNTYSRDLNPWWSPIPEAALWKALLPVAYSSVCICFSLRRYLVPAVLIILFFIPEFCQFAQFINGRCIFFFQITTFLLLCNYGFSYYCCMIYVTLPSSASNALWENFSLVLCSQNADSSQLLAPFVEAERDRLNYFPTGMTEVANKLKTVDEVPVE